MKPLAAVALSLALVVFGACAHAEGIQIAPAGSTPTLIGGVDNFSGQVAVDIKAAGDSGQHAGVGIVTFMPGARTAWHTHPVGQLLIVTDGRGWVQEDGQPRREIKAGDVVWIEAGVKHWHGAAKDSRMNHLAIAYMQGGRNADWKELVTDEQYNAR
ncbi:MAG: cupin domain-containing protein [Proteobacteria bacterium]|nr:cupin domain-containing protein [Pseudomonadota bacterium]